MHCPVRLPARKLSTFAADDHFTADDNTAYVPQEDQRQSQATPSFGECIMAAGEETSRNATGQPDDPLRFEPYEFVTTQPGFAVFLLLVVGVAGVVGTLGNVLILISVATRKELRNVQSVFIVNLACSDLYVTMLADPLSIVAKTVGWRWFESVPYLCRAVGSLCTISCVGSLMTLSAMAFNRYILICHHSLYRRLFTFRNSILMCSGVYVVGLLLVFLNFAGVGDHSFDHKSLECIFDRMANHNYTIVFAIVLVWVPIVIIGLSYTRIFLHVRASRKKLVVRKKENSKTTSATETENTTPGLESGGKQAVDDKASADGASDRSGHTTQGVSLKDPATWVHKNPMFRSTEAGPGESAASTASNKYGGLVSVSFNIPEAASKGRSLALIAAERKTEESDAATEESDTAGGDTSATATEDSRDVSSQLDSKSTPSTARRKKSKKRARGNASTTFRVARTLFIIYLVFAACWLPYSLLLILDADDTYSHEVHSAIVVWAHLHPSINWLVYYHTYSKFREAFRSLLRLDRCC